VGALCVRFAAGLGLVAGKGRYSQVFSLLRFERWSPDKPEFPSLLSLAPLAGDVGHAYGVVSPTGLRVRSLLARPLPLPVGV